MVKYGYWVELVISEHPDKIFADHFTEDDT